MEVESERDVPKVVPESPRSKLGNLKQRAYIRVDPEELVHLDWFREWRSALHS